MKNLIKYISALSLIFLFNACEIEPRIIELPEHNSQLTITAALTPQDDSLNTILFNYSIGIQDVQDFDSENYLINPSLSLTTPDQGVIDGYIFKDVEDYSEFESARFPLWKFDYIDFIPGETYVLHGSAEGYEDIQTSVTIPQVPELSSVKITKSDDTDPTRYFQRDLFEIEIDPAGESNYYRIRARPIIKDNTTGIIGSSFRFYGNYSNPIDESTLEKRITVVSDELFDGEKHTMLVYGERGSYDFDQVEFDLIAITEAEFLYFNAVEKLNNDNPFTEPVTIQSNISNGYGLFSISSPPNTLIVTVD